MTEDKSFENLSVEDKIVFLANRIDELHDHVDRLSQNLDRAVAIIKDHRHEGNKTVVVTSVEEVL